MQIPVVMAANEAFAMPACVAMHSILANKKITVNYRFYLLVQKKFSRDITSKFDKLFHLYAGSCLEYIEMDTQFDDVPANPRFTKEAYYRLKIADILSNENKCIYLDADIIVNGDISELWTFNLGNNYVGAVIDVLGQHRCKPLGILNESSYINSGVLLFNLHAIRRDDITEKFMKLTGEGYVYPDQDIINKVCNGRISFLPFKYNVMVQTMFSSTLFNGVYSGAKVNEALDNPLIIHYNIGEKPWNTYNIHARLYHLWHKNAADSPFNMDVNKDLFNAKFELPLTPDFYETRYKELVKSSSYRIGRVITFIPGLIKRIIRG